MEALRRIRVVGAALIAAGCLASPHGASANPFETVATYPWALDDARAIDLNADGGPDLIGLGPEGVMRSASDDDGNLADPEVLISGEFRSYFPIEINGGDSTFAAFTQGPDQRLQIFRQAGGQFEMTGNFDASGEQPQLAVNGRDLLTLSEDGQSVLVRYREGVGRYSAPSSMPLEIPTPQPSEAGRVIGGMGGGFGDGAIVATADASGNGDLIRVRAEPNGLDAQEDLGVTVSDATAVGLAPLGGYVPHPSFVDLMVVSGGRLLIYDVDYMGNVSSTPIVIGDGGGASLPGSWGFVDGNGPPYMVAGVSPYGGALYAEWGSGSALDLQGDRSLPVPDGPVASGWFDADSIGATFTSGGRTYMQLQPFYPETTIEDSVLRDGITIYRHHAPAPRVTSEVRTGVIECRVDGGAWSPCSGNGGELTGLAIGAHTLRARARNRDWADPTPASIDFSVDTPETRIVAGPPARSHKRSIEYALTSNASYATFQCALDNHRFRSCPRAGDFGPIKPGWHVLRARARTERDLVDEIPDSWGFTVTKGKHRHR